MTTYKLVPCADSFFIVDAREDGAGRFEDSKYPSAWVRGHVTRKETLLDGWSRSITEPVIGAREFAERLVAALNEAHAVADPLTNDDSAHLPIAAE